MANEQVKDVLESTQRLHERARRFFAHLASRSDKPRVQMLLDYLAGHEGDLAAAVRAFEEGADARVLDTWVTSAAPVSHLADELDWDQASHDSASFDELVELGMTIDNRVVELYQELATRAEPAWLQEIFQNLLEMEQQGEKEVAKQTLRALDL